MAIHYDVYIHSDRLDDPIIRTVRASDPDDAIYRCQRKGELIPQAGDRVVRCIEVNRDPRPETSMHGHLA